MECIIKTITLILKHDYDIVVGSKLRNPGDINLPNFEAKPIKIQWKFRLISLVKKQ